jgi:hypothetical protein
VDLPRDCHRLHETAMKISAKTIGDKGPFKKAMTTAARGTISEVDVMMDWSTPNPSFNGRNSTDRP